MGRLYSKIEFSLSGVHAPIFAQIKIKFGVEESTFDGVVFTPIGAIYRPCGAKNFKIAPE